MLNDKTYHNHRCLLHCFRPSTSQGENIIWSFLCPANLEIISGVAELPTQIQAFEHNCKQLSTPSPSLFTWAWYIFRQNMDHLAFKPFQIPAWGTFCKQMVCGGIYLCLLLFYWLSRSMTYLGKVKKSQLVLLSLREHAFPFGKSLSVSTKSTYFGQE